ncbi:hypothetical protein CYD30_11305 [Kosakonia cowanii]|nr:hypothetical protein CYD30_11305 [Kosakonia cowanii]
MNLICERYSWRFGTPGGRGHAENGWFLHFHGGGSRSVNLLIFLNNPQNDLYIIFFSLSSDQFAIN